MGTFRPLPHADLVFSERFIKLLTNFVTDGKPSLTMESGKEILLEEQSGFGFRDFMIQTSGHPERLSTNGPNLAEQTDNNQNRFITQTSACY